MVLPILLKIPTGDVCLASCLGFCFLQLNFLQIMKILPLKSIANALALIRFNKPTGTWLLLLPALHALWVASAGNPDIALFVIVIIGAFIMRSAGCIINDISDRDIDLHVGRTKDRPITAKKISITSASILFTILLGFALLLIYQFPARAQLYALAGVGLTVLYPLAKRWLPIPQLFLAVTYSWGTPIVFAMVQNTVPPIGWWLFAANFCWIMAFDTIYSLADIADDQHLGIYSSAIFFAERVFVALTVFQIAAIGIWIYVAITYQYMTWIYAVCMALIAALFIYQQYTLRRHGNSVAFAAFKNNQYVGLLLWLSVVV